MLSKKFQDHHLQAPMFYKSLYFGFVHCDNRLLYNRIALCLAELDISLAQTVAEEGGAPISGKQVMLNHG